MTTLALDPGYGNSKLYGAAGGVVLPSVVSVGDGKSVRRMAGVRMAKPPLRIQTDAGVFHVGESAHDWGRPIENMDFERLTGAPEMLALVYGAATRYGVPQDPVGLMVGLPISSMMGEGSEAVQRQVRKALCTAHNWSADGVERSMTVERVRITSQPVGAMFDYLLTDDGQMTTAGRAASKGEMGILGVGMNTLDLLVVRKGSPVQRFTGGGKVGVRRLLELMDHQGTYSLAELDAQLRSGGLDIDDALPIWQSEVLGFIERQWADAFGRLGMVVGVGGGIKLLREAMLRRFRERLHIPDDPIIATARGLFKYTLMKARRRRRG